MGFVTAEKISPSPIGIMADISKAVEMEKKIGRGTTALRDVLGRVVSEYNKMIVNKKHRIDAGRKNLLLNLFLGFFLTACTIFEMLSKGIRHIGIQVNLGFDFPGKL